MKKTLFYFFILIFLSSCANDEKDTILGSYNIYEATMYQESVGTSGKLAIENIDNLLNIQYRIEYKCGCSYQNTDSISLFHCTLKQNGDYYELMPVESIYETSYEGKVQYDKGIITIYDLKGDYIKAKKE